MGKANESSVDQARRRLRGYLNKLSDSNYVEVSAKLQGEREVFSDEILVKEFVDLVFTKCMQMGNFLNLYTKIVVDAAATVKKYSNVKFNRLIKTVCQEHVTKTILTDLQYDDEGLDENEKLEAEMNRKDICIGLSHFIVELAHYKIISPDLIR